MQCNIEAYCQGEPRWESQTMARVLKIPVLACDAHREALIERGWPASLLTPGRLIAPGIWRPERGIATAR